MADDRDHSSYAHVYDRFAAEGIPFLITVVVYPFETLVGRETYRYYDILSFIAGDDEITGSECGCDHT